MLDFFLRFESDCATAKFNNSLSRFDGCTVRFTVYLRVYSVHGIKVDALIGLHLFIILGWRCLKGFKRRLPVVDTAGSGKF